MQDYPLTVGAILRHGTSVHAQRQVRTLQPDGTVRASTFHQVGLRTAQLANALRDVGVTADTRVATFMWNNQEHVEAYCAIPAMGAVLHTLNIRLAAEQISFIANHAEDEVVIVDGSLTEQLASFFARASDGAHRHCDRQWKFGGLGRVREIGCALRRFHRWPAD